VATKNITAKPDLYSDFRTDFLIHPMKKDLVMVKNEDSVIQSIKNLLYTGQYERFWQPDINAGLRHYLFELPSKMTEIGIRDSIMAVIRNHEPRAELIEVYVSLSVDESAYEATIVFSVVNREEAISFTTLLQRLR